MKRYVVALFFATLIGVATSAESAETKGQFSISPVAGGYTFEGAQHLKTGPVYGGRLGYNFTQDFGIEALFDYARTKDTKSSETATLYRFGTDLLCYLLPESRLVPYLAVGISGIKIDGKGRNNDLRAGLDYGAGIKYFVTDAFALRADVRHIIYNQSSVTFNNLEYTLGGYFPFGSTKPAVAPIASTPATIPVAETAAPKVEPAPVPAPATVAKPVESAVVTPPPSQPTRIVVPVMTRKAETSQKTVTAKRFCNKPATLAITFDTGKADIKTEYHQELAVVGIFLKEFPEARGTIEGHTDNAGPLALNMTLSKKRAENVRDFIVTAFGIDASRIAAVGFGPAKPVATNKNAAGKTKNRRIEAVFTCK
ncbi:MAG TPA: outer membrane beta-barrel domain-containing protein [Desulfuromonadales bacterium]|nr:outer membrane beta-barrel domain-containing protein [Desulfuromonadales bacterium]